MTTPAQTLNAVVADLIAGQHVDPDRFFCALEITRTIARECAEQAERLQAENERLHNQNNHLAWLIIHQAQTIQGLKAYQA